jgi:hypothetical protein
MAREGGSSEFDAARARLNSRHRQIIARRVSGHRHSLLVVVVASSHHQDESRRTRCFLRLSEIDAVLDIFDDRKRAQRCFPSMEISVSLVGTSVAKACRWDPSHQVPELTRVYSYLSSLSRLFNQMVTSLLYQCRIQMLIPILINLLTGSQPVKDFIFLVVMVPTCW